MSGSPSPDTWTPIGEAAARVAERVRPGVEVLRPASREEWLALRRQTVGASEAPALIGISPYATAYGLWATKSGAIPLSAEETGAMRRGRMVEPIAAAMLAEDRPGWSISPNRIPGGEFYRDLAAGLSATPDCFAVDPERPGFGVVQFKSVEAGIFRRTWRDEETGETSPPLWVAVQAIVEAELTGASWAAAGALVVGFGIDLHVIDVPLHPGVIGRIRGAVADFWTMIREGRKPDPDYGRDAALIADVYREGAAEEEIDISADNRWVEIATEDARLAAEIKARQEARAAVRAEFLHKIGAAEIVRANGRIVATARTVRKQPYTVNPKPYRDIRFKETAP